MDKKDLQYIKMMKCLKNFDRDEKSAIQTQRQEQKGTCIKVKIILETRNQQN